MKGLLRPRLVLPLTAAALALPALGACSQLSNATSCASDIEAKVNALLGAVDLLVKVSDTVSLNVGNACVAIATDLGQKPPALGMPDDDNFDANLKAACDAATAGIEAELKAGAMVSVQVVGGECHVNADAQFSCEAKCAVNGSCDPGSVALRCDPGQLSGECDATCKGSCTVTTGSVDCQGSCSGQCNGTCDAACSAMDGSGKCAGKCAGNCTGKCSGTCSVVPPMAVCSGSCKGGCSVAYKAPQCEGKLQPPKCNIDADCEAGCSAQAELDAACTPPSLDVVVTGGVTGKLASTLKTNLPALLSVAVDGAKLFGDAATAVVNTAPGAIKAAVNIPACAVEFTASALARVDVSVKAQAHVEASLSASASVGGKVGVM